MGRLRVEVVYATRSRQDLVALELEAGSSALDALRASGLAEHHPEIALDSLLLGIFGRRVKPEVPLADGDRVEVYRSLLVNPKEARRDKAARKGRIRRLP